MEKAVVIIHNKLKEKMEDYIEGIKVNKLNLMKIKLQMIVVTLLMVVVLVMLIHLRINFICLIALKQLDKV